MIVGMNVSMICALGSQISKGQDKRPQHSLSWASFRGTSGGCRPQDRVKVDHGWPASRRGLGAQRRTHQTGSWAVPHPRHDTLEAHQGSGSQEFKSYDLWKAFWSCLQNGSAVVDVERTLEKRKCFVYGGKKSKYEYEQINYPKKLNI